VTEAFREAERTVGESFAQIFRARTPVGLKVRTLFTRAAAGCEANEIAKECPVATVTLDLDGESTALREACDQVLDRWVDVIVQGFDATRIVGASGVYLRSDSDAASRSTRTDHQGGA
jgi:hypothetical protein